MYTYKYYNGATGREKDAIMIKLFITALGKFNKIHQQRLSECNSDKWQKILKDVKAEVTEALRHKSDLSVLKLVKQYTKELEGMDVSEFFPKPKLQPAPVAIDHQQRRQLEKDHMLGHPTGERIFSFRRRTRNTPKPEREKYHHRLQVA